MSPRISVVVPVYNVAAYLETCLESLAQQTSADLEIVMVDDGSTDESPEIAKRFAADDGRFRLVHQANAGLSAARNTGIDHAAGEFLAFVDSDDVLPRHALELLVGALDRTGSDFASGDVRRLTSFGTTRTRFLVKAFERTRLKTHVTRFPALLADRTAWNKLFRRSFWDRHGFRFPEGAIFEDTPVILPAHVLAGSVDVIEQTVYFWRTREGAELSITQRRTEPKALRDRVAAVDYVSRFLADRGLKRTKSQYDRSVVGDDFRHYLNVLPRANEDYRRLFLDLVNDFLDRAADSALDQPLAIERLAWQLVRRRRLAELLEVLRFKDEDLREQSPVRGLRGWYGDYPYRNDPRLRIPRRVYRLDEELTLVSSLDDVRWEGDLLRLEGHAYIEQIGAPARETQRVELVLRRVGSRRRPLRLRTEQVHRPDVTAAAGQELAALDWSGFVALLDLRQLSRGGRLKEGVWEIGFVVAADGVRRRGWRARPAAFHPIPVVEHAADGADVRAALSESGRLTVHVQRRRPVVHAYLLDDSVLQLEGDAGSLRGEALTLEVERRMGGATLAYPVHVDNFRDGAGFLARIPLGDLIGEVDVADRAARAVQHGDGIAWDVYLVGDRRWRLTLDSDAPESTWTIREREVAVHRTRFGNLTVVERSFRPVIRDVRWSSTGALVLSGTFRAPRGDYDLVVSARRGPEICAAAVEYDPGTAHFTVELAPARVRSFGRTRPLEEGLYELLVRPRSGRREEAVSAVLAHELLDELPVSETIDRKQFRFGVHGYETPVLRVEQDLDLDERGGFRQRQLRTAFYRGQRSRKLRDVVLYECFGGREYSDSPRALHEELVRREAPLEHLWVVRDGSFRVPDSARAVREQSREYYEAFARARYVVANDYWPRWADRRPEQTWLQTWHGAPLKAVGHELADRPKAVAEHRRVLRQRSENWHYLVSPGAFATPILRRAFPQTAEVLETGLPRTDLLLGADRERLAEETRRCLGLAAGKRVVLYAPTYRDHLAARDGYRLGPLLDIQALHGALGDDHVLLFRKHPLVAGTLTEEAARCVVDVSEFANTTALLLVADVLVSDYSSIVFDYAATRRPMVFFTPDLEAYRDEIRGFSIDFEAAAPGPLLRTTEEVIEALREPDALAAEYRERYEAFLATYCPLDDGRASSRLVDRVFAGATA